jgi:hypothetical protein
MPDDVQGIKTALSHPGNTFDLKTIIHQAAGLSYRRRVKEVGYAAQMLFPGYVFDYSVRIFLLWGRLGCRTFVEHNAQG